MAEKYELGQGYVQIIPSAKGISGKISAMLDPEAEKAGESAGKKAGDGLSGGIKSKASKIGKEIGIAIAAVGTATGKLIKDALAEYGEYEQLTGGVAKLFGDNADAVLKNASNAFRSAQLSANEYMQTVTSFSASLISSLGGDTEKAVGYADMAISDMADNANTFGTSMESIQNAYQGFAKQNYTMLDNLKLGYGGTKTEMERLVEDAEGLNSAFKATRDENGKLTLSFADIVDAIHIVQDNMGITGTTAKEASSTIQGSINSMKAAWKNLLTGLGDPNADVKALTKNVVDSAKQVIKNVMPIIKNVLKEIPGVLGEIWNSLGTGKSTIAALGVSIAGLKLGGMISQLGLISPAAGIAVGGFVALGAAIVKLNYDMIAANQESDIMYQRQQVLAENTAALTDAVNASAQAYEQQSAARQSTMNANTSEIENVQTLWGELKTLLETNNELSESDQARAQFIVDQVNTALGTEYELTDLLTGKKFELIDAIDQELAARKDAIALQVLEEGYAEAIRNQSAAQEEFNRVAAERSAVEVEASEVRRQLAEMDAQAEANFQLKNQQWWQAEYGALLDKQKAYADLTASLDADYQKALNTVAGYVADKAMYEDAAVAHAEGTFDLETFMSAETRDAYIADAKASAEGVAAANADATQATLDGLAAQLSALTGSEWEFRDAGDGTILAYKDGVAAGTPLVESQIKKMISDMQTSVQNSKSGFETSTGYIIDGIKGTINGRQSEAVSAVVNLATAMNKAYDRTNQIKSPSRLYAKSTQWIGQGIIRGLESEEDQVLDSVRDMATAMSGAYNAVLDDNTTFSATRSLNSITNETSNYTGTITTSGTDSKLDAVYNLLATYFPQMLEASERDVVLDGGKLVGSLAPKINTELGKLNVRNGRGGICTA